MARIERPKLEDSAEAWLVYGDALQADGDPWGELVAINHAVAGGAAPGRREAYLDAHAAALLGPLALHRGNLEIAWRYCVPETVTLRVRPGDDAGALVAALFDSPVGADMRRLRLLGLTGSARDTVDLAPAVARLAKLPAACTSLELVDERARTATRIVSSDYDPGRNLVQLGDLGPVWKIPHLKSFALVVADPQQVALGTIDAPTLESFELRGLRWPTAYRQASQLSQLLSGARWPGLRRLVLQLPETYTYSWPDQTGAYVRLSRYDEENDEYGDEDGYSDNNWRVELDPILQSLAKTRIETLGLSDFSNAAPVLAALVDHLPPTVQHLDLSDSDTGDGNVPYLLEHSAVFGRLKTLDLRRTQVADVGPLKGLGPTVLHEPGGGARYQFAVGME